MSKSKKYKLPDGVKIKGTEKIDAEVLKELNELDWLKEIPQHPDCPTMPFPYGTAEPIFK